MSNMNLAPSHDSTQNKLEGQAPAESEVCMGWGCQQEFHVLTRQLHVSISPPTAYDEHDHLVWQQATSCNTSFISKCDLWLVKMFNTALEKNEETTFHLWQHSIVWWIDYQYYYRYSRQQLDDHLNIRSFQCHLATVSGYLVDNKKEGNRQLG